MASKFKTVDEYISSFPKDTQKLLQNLRETLLSEIKDAEEVISYAIPAIKQDGEFVIYYSGWKNHLSLYPYTADMVKEFKESSDYVTSGKGTIQFPLDQPLPLPLIKKIAAYRLKLAKNRKEAKEKKYN